MSGCAGDAGPKRVKDGYVFQLKAADAKSVSLVGDFNNWDAGASRLSDANGDGVWTITVNLPSGRHTYGFVVEGPRGIRWVPPPGAEAYEDDGLGGQNGVIVIP
jgi:1,4-alpha-glucan branching enzyme